MNKTPNLILSETGFICHDSEPDEAGQWQTSIVHIPSGWHKDPSSIWIKGLALASRIDEENGLFHVRIYLSGDHAQNAQITLYSGTQENAKSISKKFLDIWLKANAMHEHAAAAAAPASISPEPVNQDVMATKLAQAHDHNPSSTAMARMMWGGGMALLFVAIAFGAYYVANTNFTSDERPALDLSALKIDELSRIETNPMALNLIQDEMMSAVKAGQQIAMDQHAMITDEHIETLKAMGLNPGTSMSSAASCLSNF